MTADLIYRRKLKIAAAIAISFCLLMALVVTLLIQDVITYQMALLSLVALLGLYCGFGVLVAIYRFVARLE